MPMYVCLLAEKCHFYHGMRRERKRRLFSWSLWNRRALLPLSLPPPSLQTQVCTPCVRRVFLSVQSVLTLQVEGAGKTHPQEKRKKRRLPNRKKNILGEGQRLGRTGQQTLLMYCSILTHQHGNWNAERDLFLGGGEYMRILDVFLNLFFAKSLKLVFRFFISRVRIEECWVAEWWDWFSLVA